MHEKRIYIPICSICTYQIRSTIGARKNIFAQLNGTNVRSIRICSNRNVLIDRENWTILWIFHDSCLIDYNIRRTNGTDTHMCCVHVHTERQCKSCVIWSNDVHTPKTMCVDGLSSKHRIRFEVANFYLMNYFFNDDVSWLRRRLILE